MAGPVGITAGAVGKSLKLLGQGLGKVASGVAKIPGAKTGAIGTAIVGGVAVGIPVLAVASRHVGHKFDANDVPLPQPEVPVFMPAEALAQQAAGPADGQDAEKWRQFVQNQRGQAGPAIAPENVAAGQAQPPQVGA